MSVGDFTERSFVGSAACVSPWPATELLLERSAIRAPLTLAARTQRLATRVHLGLLEASRDVHGALELDGVLRCVLTMVVNELESDGAFFTKSKAIRHRKQTAGDRREDPSLTVGRTALKAMDYVLHVELGGLAGIVAPMTANRREILASPLSATYHSQKISRGQARIKR